MAIDKFRAAFNPFKTHLARVAITECIYIDEKLKETVQELSDLKFALDKSAIVAITGTLLILQNRLKSRGEYPEIALVKDYDNLSPVACYASQLNQVFMNILSNAIDALENQPEPRVITIKTQQTTADSVLISIADNGAGIPEEIQQRLFDPFLTTKPAGKGTGLG